jgi:hypothetical protein
MDSAAVWMRCLSVRTAFLARHHHAALPAKITPKLWIAEQPVDQTTGDRQ